MKMVAIQIHLLFVGFHSVNAVHCLQMCTIQLQKYSKIDQALKQIKARDTNCE